MYLKAFSLYRGYSNKVGIGEQPGDIPGADEQYIAADAALWTDADLADRARPWMTLYDDQKISEVSSELGEKIEAWSYFDYRRLRFVVRLVSGGEFGPGRRLAYFSHGQAWDMDTFRNGYDPGALLGRSEAFHPPWREGQPIQQVRSVEPAMVWKELVREESTTAVQLLANLYRACVVGPPVIMGVPWREFVASGRIHQLVSFARAALPLDLKRDCRIRIFTGRPEIYLRKLKAHLVVIPEDLAPTALTARPDAVLLNRDGKRKVGPEADTRYAETVRELALQSPDFLLAFAGRVKLPSNTIPDAPQAFSVVPISYNLAVASGDQAKMDSLLRHFLEGAERRERPLSWEELIRPEEWGQFSNAILVELALSYCESRDSRALRQRIREETRQRGLSVDDRVPLWLKDLSAGNSPREIVELLDAHLISPRLTALLLGHIGGNQIGELLADPKMADLIAEATSSAEIPNEWQDVLTQETKFFQNVVSLARKFSNWRPTAYRMIANLVTGQALPPEVASELVDIPPPDPSTNLQTYLDLAEVLDHARLEEARTRIKALGVALTDRNSRRQLLEFAKNARWRALQNYFVPPETWEPDVGDVVLNSPEWLHKINTGQVVRLVKLKEALPESVRLLLDERMQLDPEGTTKSLTQANGWLMWRLSTTLREPWGYSKTWLLNQPSNLALEEWKQVILDLSRRGFSSADLKGLRARFPSRIPPWPLIKPFGKEQVQDMTTLCSDLEMLADLAEALAPLSPLYEDTLRNSRFGRQLPEQVLRCLRQPALILYSTQLTLDQAQFLSEHAGGLRTEALKLLTRVVIKSLVERTDEAEKAADRANLWHLPDFWREVEKWLCEEVRRRSLDQKVLAMLDRHLAYGQARSVGKSDDLRKLARECHTKGFIHLADFLWPGLRELFRSEALYESLVHALCKGDARHDCWKDLIRRTTEFRDADEKAHPLIRLAEQIRRLGPEQQHFLDRNGWNTFEKVCGFASEPPTPLFRPQGGRLPILPFAAVMRDDTTIGSVAAGILCLRGVNLWFPDRGWWDALFGGIVRCRRRSGRLEARDRSEAAFVVLFSAMRSLPMDLRIGMTELERHVSQRD